MKVAINYEDLYNAYTKNDHNLQYILDCMTGELISDSNILKSNRDWDEIYAIHGEDPNGRYRPLPFMLIHDQRHQMKMEFIEAIKNDDLRGRLFKTSRMEKGHKRFLKILQRAGEQNRWNLYELKYWTEDLKNWLEEEEIEIIDTISRDNPKD